MSNGSPKFERRQQALEAARRRLRHLEIEAHRIRADLARLEAEYEDDVADRLTRTLRRKSPDKNRVDAPHFDVVPSPVTELVEPDLLPLLQRPAVESSPRENKPRKSIPINVPERTDGKPLLPNLEQQAAAPRIEPNEITKDRNSGEVKKRQRKAAYRQTAPPIMFSLAVHAVLIVLCMTFGFATLVQQSARLFASPAEFSDESPEEFSEVKIESTRLDDAELQNVLSESDDFNISDDSLRDFDQSQLGLGSQPHGDIGQLDSLPSELGTLMAGAGSPGSGPPGGEVGDAIFFGTRSQGNRIVFVVDNSSSSNKGKPQ